MFKELKNGIEISVGQAVFKLWIKTVKTLFWSIRDRSQSRMEADPFDGLLERNSPPFEY